MWESGGGPPCRAKKKMLENTTPQRTCNAHHSALALTVSQCDRIRTLQSASISRQLPMRDALGLCYSLGNGDAATLMMFCLARTLALHTYRIRSIIDLKIVNRSSDCVSGGHLGQTDTFFVLMYSGNACWRCYFGAHDVNNNVNGFCALNSTLHPIRVW